jgi:hypothetical protein
MDDYPHIRASLAPRYASIPAPQLEAMVAERFQAEAQDVENFLSDFARTALDVGRTVLPFAGPLGMAASAGLGALQSALPGQRPPAPPPQPASATLRSQTSTTAQRTRAAQLPANPAAAYLALQARPEVARGMSALALGEPGLRDITVGTTTVPVSAIANLLSTLLTQATASANATRPAEDSGEDVPAYVRDRPGIDPFNSVERAAALYELFESTPVEANEAADESAYDEWAYDESAYDAEVDWNEGIALYESAFEDES